MLEVAGLTKCYARIPAVQDVSFCVRPHHVLGYLGPNGSGKSTTVNMLAGLLQPTSGEILLEGRPIRDGLIEYKRRLGYVPEEPNLYPYLSGWEYLQLVGRLRSIPQRVLDEKAGEFLRLFSLHSDRHVQISSYSKGMKQKILITAALLHNPDVLLFDEPLSGLDVTSALVFKHLVKSLAAAGKIVVYSSHVLEVVEKVCSEVIILRRGRVAAHDSVERLRDLMRLPSLEDIFSELAVPEDTGKVAREMIEVMRWNG